MSIGALPVETKDEELLRLANAAVNGGAPAPAPVPVDPLAPTPVPTPNGPIVEGPTEMPGDRALPLPDMSTPPAPPPVTPQAPPPPLSPAGGVAALDAARTAANATADATANVGAAKSEESRLNADVQDNVAAEERASINEVEMQQEAILRGREHAQRIADNAAKEAKNYKFSDWWGDQSSLSRLNANLHVMAGAYAATVTGGKNMALEKINTIIDQTHRREVAEQRSLYDFAKLKAEGSEQFNANMRQDMAALGIKNSMRRNAVADEAKAQLIRNGIPADEAENDVLVKTQRAKAEAEYAKAYGDLVSDAAKLAMSEAHFQATNAIARGQLNVARQNANTNANRLDEKAPTEAEGNNAARGRNMALALDNLEKAGLSQYKPSEEALNKWFSNQERIEAAAENNKSLLGQGANFVQRKVGAIPTNELDGLSEKDKKYFSLMRQVVEPYARKQSGAAIARTEWQNFAAQTGLGTGEFGKNLRDQAARDMITLGGRATRKLEESDKSRGVATPGSASINAGGKTPTVVETRTINGKKWHKLSDGRFVSE